MVFIASDSCIDTGLAHTFSMKDQAKTMNDDMSPSWAVAPPQDSLARQWLVRCQNVTRVLDLSGNNETREAGLCQALLRFISDKTGWPESRLCLESIHYPFATIQVASSVLGGKGGFGTLLKGQSKQAGAKRTTDFGACRDLQGRRLRHVNDEIKLRQWREMQQQKERGQEVDESGMWKTASGLYNWHLMVPNWASDSLSNKATRTMQRKMEREVDHYKSEEEKKKLARQEQERLYQQSVVQYAQEGLRSHKTDYDVKKAILQGLKHKKHDRSQPKRKLVSVDASSTDKSTIEDLHEQALVALSGEWVTKKTSDGNAQIQCKSDFGTMALVLDRGLSASDRHASIYMEIALISGGLAQVGWADLKEFGPDNETGDGVGDDSASYAYDGSRQLKFHSGSETPYGEGVSTWTANDIVGIQYQPATGEVSFSQNGSGLGVAFTTTPERILVPAMSCNQHEILELRIQMDAFQHMPNQCIAVGDLLSVSAVNDDEPVDETDAITSQARTSRSDLVAIRAKKRKPMTPTTPSSPILEPVDLNSYDSAKALEELGMDRLKGALMAIGVKAGGSLQERASRLFSLRGLERKDFPMKVRSKSFRL